MQGKGNLKISAIELLNFRKVNWDEMWELVQEKKKGSHFKWFIGRHKVIFNSLLDAQRKSGRTEVQERKV